MAYCLCRVRGSNVMCLAVPQPRPELRFAGPYVLQAPLVHMPNVSSVFLTHDKHMHTSSASFMHILENMTTNELFQCVKDMELELGIPRDQRVQSWDMNDDSLVEYVKDILIPKKNEVLENKIRELDNISTQWQDLMQNLHGEVYRMHDNFEFAEFGKFFFALVEKTQTCMKSMKGQQGFEESLFFGHKLVDSLHKINENLEIANKMRNFILDKRYNITRHWKDYQRAGVNILVSLRGLQTTQEKIIKQLTDDGS